MKNNLTITDAKKIDKKKWSDFIYNHHNGNIFQTPEMFNVYTKTKKYEPVFLAVVNGKGEIAGTLLAVIQKEYSGVLGNFTARSIIHGGPLVKDDDPAVLDKILKEYNKIIKRRAIYTQFRNFRDYLPFNDLFQMNGYYFTSHLNYLIDTAIGEEAVWKNIHKSRRKRIKKAVKNGLTVDVLEKNIEKKYINIGYGLIQRVYKKAQLPLANYGLFECAAKNNIIIIIFVKYKEQIIGCRFALKYKNQIYGWYAGSRSEYYNLSPNDLLIWETLKWGMKNGYKLFDYGGAGDPNKPYGVRRFKSQAGGMLVNYGRYEKVHQPMIFKIAKIGFKFWQKIKQ